MKRVLFIVLGLMVATTLFGLMVAFTRPIKWPGNVASTALRRALGEGTDEPIEEEAAA